MAAVHKIFKFPQHCVLCGKEDADIQLSSMIDTLSFLLLVDMPCLKYLTRTKLVFIGRCKKCRYKAHAIGVCHERPFLVKPMEVEKEEVSKSSPSTTKPVNHQHIETPTQNENKISQVSPMNKINHVVVLMMVINLI